MAIKVGTANNDTLIGTAGWDTLYGLDGNDNLGGGTGGDLLSGGVGNDTLEGGAGPDTLNGGAGNDTFLYKSFNHAGGDRIVDFKAGDKLDLSAIAGRKFIGSAQFNGVAGEIRYESYSYGSSGYTTYLSIDANGDALEDYQIRLDGKIAFTETAANSGILIAATNQTLVGDANANTLTGGAGDDKLSGGDGNDSLLGGEGNDRLVGGNGNDDLTGGRGVDIFAGGAGNDVFRFRAPDEISGDTIKDFGGADIIAFDLPGGAFIGDAPFNGTPGQYRYEDGSIQLDNDGDMQTDQWVYVQGYSGQIQEIVGAPGRLIVAPNQTLNGTAGNDTLTGGNGNDTANGNVGNDTINGGQGKDVLHGDAGDDSIVGGTGNDSLYGDAGNDALIGGLGQDTLEGGAGNDTFKFVSLLEMGGVSSSYGGGFGGLAGNYDRITDLAAGDKVDLSAIPGLVFAGVGNGFSETPNQIATMQTRQYIGGGYAYTTYLEIDEDGDGSADYALTLAGHSTLEETAAGSKIFQVAANKTLTGDANPNTLTGGNGEDSISGLGGNDSLGGGYGRDELDGGAGDDILVGGVGGDWLTGGDGNDTFKYVSLLEIGTPGYGSVGPYGASGQDGISDFTVGDKIDLSAIPGLTFAGLGKDFSGVANQVITRSNGDTTYLDIDTDGNKYADYSLQLDGKISIEEIAAGSKIFQAVADKTLTGTAAADTLTGGNGNDSISGLDGNDALSGNYGDDSINGDNGNDTITGGLGSDNLSGGAGNDTFKYASLAEMGNSLSYPYVGDTISDFAAGDKIDLSAIAGLTYAGIGKSFTGVANQIIAYNNGSAAYLMVDTDGNHSADYGIALSGVLKAIEETAAGSKIFQIVADKTLTGTAAADTLTGGNGNDSISGLDGNDALSGGPDGNDSLNGGNGDDILNGGWGADNLTGGAGNDTFKFGTLAEMGNRFYGYSGDTITDLAVGDKIDLSAIAGLTFAGVGKGLTGTANQVAIGQNGATYYLVINTNTDLSPDYSIALNGNPTIEETAAGSKIFQLVANKTLTGTAAADTLTGGNGNDSLSGLDGNDLLNGGFGNDTLIGGNGDDTLTGGLGGDSLTGGAGNDTFKFGASAEIGNSNIYPYIGDTITDFSTGDKIDLSAIAGLTFAGVGKGFTGVGNQVIASINGSDTDLQIDTNGDKSADYSLTLTGSLNLEETAAGSKIFQAATDKTLTGTAVADTLTGGNGNDSLTGLAGNDQLSGTYGKDVLNGGDGDDTLTGGLGADNLTGGAGNDTFKYGSLAEMGNANNYPNDGDRITDFATGDKVDLSAISGLTFAGVGKGFTGTANQVSIYSESSNTYIQVDADGNKYSDYSIVLTGNLNIEETAAGSKIFQVAANKTLTGSAGNDTMTGGNGNDSISGLDGNDSLTGGYGSDSLLGGNGNDTLIGGLGSDTLTGGAGTDTFKFTSNLDSGNQFPYYAQDTITDFATGDKIDLSGVDANSIAGGDQAFSFIGNGNFTGVAGQLQYNGYSITGDTNGDMSYDFAIYLSYPYPASLAATDFIL